jgi:tRNA(adenine34) deaminase
MELLTRRTCLAAALAPPLDPRHTRFMQRAIELARNEPRFPFGALLVETATGKIIAEGWNRSGQDPTFHGEMDVIHRCASQNPGIDWTKLTLYTTAEPCPMCQGAVSWTGIAAVVYGTSIPFLKSLGWWQIDIRAAEVLNKTPFRKCTLTGGVLEKECNALFLAAKKLNP